MTHDPYAAEQWVQVHADLGVQPDDAVLSDLLAHWSGEGRYYHATSHLVAGLKALDAHGPEAALVRLAWFFHDAVYVVGAPDNEAKSAQWFQSYGFAQKLSEVLIARGALLILHTKDHQNAVSDDPLWPLMNDVDLGIFAAPRPAYDLYAENVWREYEAIVPRRQFVAGRAAFMAAFKTKPIFLGPSMRDAEGRAHENIDAEIGRLNAEAAAG